MLTENGRLLRVAATGLLLLGLLIGTFWGQDDHFPFGPFRMYSTSTRGRVIVLTFRGITDDGRNVVIPPQAFGLRGAELDGQVRRLEREPHLLDHIVRTYETFSPAAPDLKEMRVVYEIHPLDEEGRPVGMERETVAVWRR